MEGGRTVKRPRKKPAAPPLSVDLPFNESKDKILKLEVWPSEREIALYACPAEQGIRSSLTVLQCSEVRICRCS